MSLPKIRAFKGITYNTQKIKNLADVMTPPYDVISPDMQTAFYDKSPYNFVRVDFNRTEGLAKYKEAGEFFKTWLAEQVLVQDQKEAIYFHHHTFKLPDGSSVTRKGFFAVRRIEDFSEGGIKPHEKTLEGPKADRLNLTREVVSNLSPVFSLYSDPEKRIDHLVETLKKQAPAYSYTSNEGELHQVWKETDPTVIRLVSDWLQQKPVFIADGHHRYETALNYRNERRKAAPPSDQLEAFNYVLMYFSNMDDEGLIILPIHRALHSIQNFSLTALLDKLSGTFTVEKVGALSNSELTDRLAKAGGEAHAFLLVTKDPSETSLISLKRNLWQSHPLAKTVPDSLAGLDVTVLHRLVFEDILGISQQAQADQTNIIYWKDTQKAINETRKGACDVTFLLNATRIGDMKQVAMAGEKMPQKSTYFYPKVPSGLVIYSLK